MSAEALSLIKNNTKQELALSLLERETELNAARIQQTKEASQRQQLILIIGGVALTSMLVLVIVLYSNYQSKRRLVAQLSEQSQKVSSLTTQHKALVH